MKLEEIKIKKSFKKTRPSLNKLNVHLEYYYKNNKFMKPIVVDKDNMLIDGYITYLIAKMFNVKEVEVVNFSIVIETLSNVAKLLSDAFLQFADNIKSLDYKKIGGKQ